MSPSFLLKLIILFSTVVLISKVSEGESETGTRQIHFVLVHGACHGSWCWYKAVTLLREAGHNVTAIDLAASGTDSSRLEDLETIDDYHGPLFSFFAALPENERPVVLVGHSMGGYAVSSAMERFPRKIALAVFVSAYMPGPDFSVADIDQAFQPGPGFYMDSQYTTPGSDPNGPPNTILFGPQMLATKIYQKSPKQDITLATLSMRWAKFFNDEESLKQLIVTKEKYGSVPRAYIIGVEDASLTMDVQRWMLERNPPDEIRAVDGADHMVMMSRPHQFSQVLQEVGFKYTSKIRL